MTKRPGTGLLGVQTLTQELASFTGVGHGE